jgi:hypothetical protein
MNIANIRQNNLWKKVPITIWNDGWTVASPISQIWELNDSTKYNDTKHLAYDDHANLWNIVDHCPEVGVNNNILALCCFSPLGEIAKQYTFHLPGIANYPVISMQVDNQRAAIGWLATDFSATYLACVDFEGTLLFQKKISNGLSGYSTGVDTRYFAIGPDGSVYVSGKSDTYGFVVKFGPTGTLLWNKKYQGDPAKRHELHVYAFPSGEVFIGGKVSDLGYLAKISPTDGSIEWQKSITRTGGDTTIEIMGICLDSQGNICVAGQTGYNTANVLAMKLSPVGAVIWSFTYVDTIYSNFNSIAIDLQDNIYCFGNWKDDGNWSVGSATKGVAMKFASDGDLIWQRFVDSTEYDYLSYAVTTWKSNYLAIGLSSTSIAYWAAHDIGVGPGISIQMPDDGSLIGTFGRMTISESNKVIVDAAAETATSNIVASEGIVIVEETTTIESSLTPAVTTLTKFL